MAPRSRRPWQFGLKALFAVLCLAAVLRPCLSAVITDPLSTVVMLLWALMICVAGLNLGMVGLVVVFVLLALLPFDLHLRSQMRKWRDQ